MGMLGRTDTVEGFSRAVCITSYDFFKYIFKYYKTLIWINRLSPLDVIRKLGGPLGRNYLINEDLNLVFVLPELQPRVSQLTANNIFYCGSCVDESVRSKIISDDYTDLIKDYLYKNKIYKHDTSSNKIIMDTIIDNEEIEISQQSDQENKRLSKLSQNHEMTRGSSFKRQYSTGDNYKLTHKPIIYVSMGTVFNNENSDLFKSKIYFIY
jgi:hypothetical protein